MTHIHPLSTERAPRAGEEWAPPRPHVALGEEGGLSRPPPALLSAADPANHGLCATPGTQLFVNEASGTQPHLLIYILRPLLRLSHQIQEIAGGPTARKAEHIYYRAAPSPGQPPRYPAPL